ncbi:fibrinogen-like YCDxxxxGGGW domain-containing protein [Pseudenhygromyxa sp. WMMC2535]|uniref:fibrinogen-like YCDxxxxGGGW domain-containing protein n=1 Tax=Pseudenhygromyxa sp. WMMC2535 TaxID=2712867 RepID=UPI0020D13C5F|nr:fibrinogen-like YCDxxxxGGGW domain-containing protein [Pseudenhygromyxa sp. WMMC2535]
MHGPGGDGDECNDDDGTESAEGEGADTSEGDATSTTGESDSGDTDDTSADADSSSGESDSSDTDDATSEGTSADTSEADTSEGDAPVCGDGVLNGDEACDDGVNDGSYGGCAEDCMSLGPHCGDAEVNGPETCDDANEDSADGCLSTCLVPASCQEILDFDILAESGAYQVGVMGPDAVFEVDCDMDTDRGGWTGIRVGNTCNGDLESTLTPVEAAPSAGIDDACRPFTQDAEGPHTYYWDIEFPPTFESFYLSGFTIKDNAGTDLASDISPDVFVQSDWELAYLGSEAGVGDVSFGAAENTGPTTSFAATLDESLSCSACETPFPNDLQLYEVDTTSSTFRIGWGEAGTQAEGWYPWWSGTIYLR